LHLSNVTRSGVYKSTNQYGVGTKGGVEPILRLIQRAADDTLPSKYKWLVSLDAKNAFNLKSRASIAEAVRKYAPGLYRAAKWAYSRPSILVVNGLDTRLEGDQWVDAIWSSEGVRQGDPLGPLLFSIAMRGVLEELQIELGPSRLIVAYLDDVYILSADECPRDQTVAFFRDRPHHLILNELKSKRYSFEDIRSQGIEALGSFIGPKPGREAFLRKKIDVLALSLAKLIPLHSQHALLLLRLSYQQQLRHLQRCLDTSDLGEVLAELDGHLWDSILTLRFISELWIGRLP
jgi:hypothetical protein